MVAKREKQVEQTVALTIAAPNFQTASFDIRGTAPYVQHKFSQKSKNEMLGKQLKTAAASGKNKAPRNISEDYEGAMHKTADGKHGIPAAAFRSAMIDACRCAGFQMTKAKMSIFVLGDDVDEDDGTPLVHVAGEPKPLESHVRLESGVASIAIRPMWKEWTVRLRLRFDADQFGRQDVANLLARAGVQVGVGEGRPYSKKSHGMGWGTFEIYNAEGDDE